MNTRRPISTDPSGAVISSMVAVLVISLIPSPHNRSIILSLSPPGGAGHG